VATVARAGTPPFPMPSKSEMMTRVGSCDEAPYWTYSSISSNTKEKKAVVFTNIKTFHCVAGNKSQQRTNTCSWTNNLSTIETNTQIIIKAAFVPLRVGIRNEK